MQQREDLPRTIGFWGASAVMVGVIIGSGIFGTPTDIARQMGDGRLILALWAVGGVLSLLGALTYAELATMFPRSGGVYVFLREGWGRATAFVFGWTYMIITKPAAASAIALLGAQHVYRALGIEANQTQELILTVAILVGLTAINAWSVRASAGVAVVLTSLKFLALVAIVVLGVAAGKLAGENFAPGPSPRADGSVWRALAPVMAAIMWTYDGWSDVGSIAGEVKDPARRLPVVYLCGTLAVTGLYLAVNAVYLGLVPLDAMREMKTIGPAVMGILIGPAGAAVMAGVIALSAIGGSHSSVLTGARVSFAQARDGLLFGFLGRESRHGTPAIALWVQLCLSVLAVLVLKDFEALTNTFTFTMWIFYGMAGAAIFVLRAKRPEVARPFRCLGYPVVPAVFVLTAVAMTVMAIVDSPSKTLPWLGVLAAGIPVYWVWGKVRHKGQLSRTTEG